jgi:uncharacterized protein
VPALFVDTGAFYAAADQSDRHHRAAAEAFQTRAGELTTSDYVFVETWCLLRARLGRTAAMRFWDALGGGGIRVLGVGSQDLVRARAIARAWKDQDFSLVDCTSFALMERLRMDEALAYDEHFSVYRYGPARRRAFRIVH